MRINGMIKPAIILLLCVSFLCCCSRKYQYVEEVIEIDCFGETSHSTKEPEIIKADNDSDAYIEAYTKYCISQQVYNKMKSSGQAEYLDVPCSFKLYNDKGEDITYVYFATRDSVEQKINQKIFSIVDADNLTKQDNLQRVKVDSVKIKELLPYFTVKKDEFDPNGGTWYKPKSAPKYTNRNAIYLYFKVDAKGKVNSLRFRVQYTADDWLFFKKIQFSIDDSAYEYVPNDTETDCGNGGQIWEWSDESLSQSDRELIYALSEAKSVKMKLIGKQYYDIKTLSKQQILDIKRTLDLYKAMGGIY